VKNSRAMQGLEVERSGKRQFGSRIEQVIEVLSTKVRLLTLEQIAESFFHDLSRPIDSARAALRRAERLGLVVTKWGMAHPRISVLAPLYRYDEAESTPAPLFGRLSWHARRRFGKAPVRTLYATATHTCKAALVGGSARVGVRTSELTHDLCVGEVWLRLRQTDPERAAVWQGEDELDSVGIRPDALTGDMAVEFVGKYSAQKLTRLYQEYVFARVPRFEFW